jgi:hypothetical protein
VIWPGPDAAGASLIDTASVIPALLNGRSQLPVREVCHCHPCLVPALTGCSRDGADANLASDTDTAAVQGESVAGDLGVEPLATVLSAQLDRGVGKRGPIPQVGPVTNDLVKTGAKGAVRAARAVIMVGVAYVDRPCLMVVMSRVS